MLFNRNFKSGNIQKCKGKLKAFIQAKWPIRSELIPVSVAWSDEEYFYSPLDGMLVHQRVIPSSKFTGILHQGEERHYQRIYIIKYVAKEVYLWLHDYCPLSFLVFLSIADHEYVINFCFYENFQLESRITVLVIWKHKFCISLSVRAMNFIIKHTIKIRRSLVILGWQFTDHDQIWAVFTYQALVFVCMCVCAQITRHA